MSRSTLEQNGFTWGASDVVSSVGSDGGCPRFDHDQAAVGCPLLRLFVSGEWLRRPMASTGELADSGSCMVGLPRGWRASAASPGPGVVRFAAYRKNRRDDGQRQTACSIILWACGGARSCARRLSHQSSVVGSTSPGSTGIWFRSLEAGCLFIDWNSTCVLTCGMHRRTGKHSAT